MPSVDSTRAPSAIDPARMGVIAALVSYLLWGFLPVLLHALDGVGAFTIVADRTIWSLLLVGAVTALSGRMGEVLRALRNPRMVLTLLGTALLLAANWLLYVWAVEHHRILEASFGYFINPLVSTAIGMVLLGERQNPVQLAAIAIAIVGIALQAIGLGDIPWIALGLAVTFGFYGYFRKLVPVSSGAGLLIETLLLVPIALAYLAFTFATTGPGLHADPQFMLLLVATGPATAVPLLLFAYSVKRLRLTTIGFFQYIAPSIQFLLAVLFFHEPLNMTRLISFGLIWLSLLVYTADSLRRAGAARAAVA